MNHTEFFTSTAMEGGFTFSYVSVPFLHPILHSFIPCSSLLLNTVFKFRNPSIVIFPLET